MKGISRAGFISVILVDISWLRCKMKSLPFGAGVFLFSAGLSGRLPIRGMPCPILERPF